MGIERRIDDTEEKAGEAARKAAELKRLDRYWFIPVFGSSKEHKSSREAKRDDKKAAKREAQYEQEEIERQQRMVYATSGGMVGHGATLPRSAPNRRIRGVEYDDTEKEMDHNLGEISNGLSRLKAMSLAMHDEIESQNVRMDRIRDRTEDAQSKVRDNTNRVKRFLK